MRALITGGATGLIGRQLIRNIESPVVLSRSPGEARRLLRSVEVHLWEPESGPAPYDGLSGTEVVFNLAGEPVSEDVGPTRRSAESAIAGSWARATWSLDLLY
jgi:NAD dependent epimerase/dehydratase family enzyme